MPKIKPIKFGEARKPKKAKAATRGRNYKRSPAQIQAYQMIKSGQITVDSSGTMQN
jgi:hypothetical protein